MPSHDIIDNRNDFLVDHIRSILPQTERAKFAVGYFFLSGLKPIRDKLDALKEVKLLIGNTLDKHTLEHISEAYKRLDLMAEAAEALHYPKRSEEKEKVAEAGNDVRRVVSVMDQGDDDQELIAIIYRMISEKRLKVRVYTKGRLHAKAYIFDHTDLYDGKGNVVKQHEPGTAIVGSSNLTLSGLTHNTELNVKISGRDNHAQLTEWFEGLWAEAQEFDAVLIEELKESWALARPTPYEIYMKTLYSLVEDRLDGAEQAELFFEDKIMNDLADFQKRAFHVAVNMIREHGGCFVADVVGLGKSFIGAAIVKHFERTDRARPLIICPRSLKEMWETYNEFYELNARVLSMGMLREEDEGCLDILQTDVKFKDRNFILLDESHNFRNNNTQRYRVLQQFLQTGDKRCVFLTATPRNKSPWDIYHQLKLFHQDDRTFIPIDPPDLREFFRKVESKERNLPELLYHILYRRRRRDIIRSFGYDEKTQQRIDPAKADEYLDGKKRAYVLVKGKHQFFPKRDLRTETYSIEASYHGLYQDIRAYLGKPKTEWSDKKEPPKDALTYAKYGLWHYVEKARRDNEPYRDLERAGHNLRGIMRVLLFKRLESSVHAFRETVRRLIRIHEMFRVSLDRGVVPAGEDAQQILYESDLEDFTQFGAAFSALKAVTGKYRPGDFKLDRLKTHVCQDHDLLKKLLKMVEAVTPDKDAKLQKLRVILKGKEYAGRKVLIFTQFADTAQYLFDQLNPGGGDDRIEVIYSGDKSKVRVVGRFAPVANPEYRLKSGEVEIQTLVATDVLAEGLNLQDCNIVVNYDLHWNPVRLIQRIGRVDRIGTEHDTIHVINFLPELALEKNLGLKKILANRIAEIHETIGEDAAILDPTEKINENSMYAIYGGKPEQMDMFEDDKEEDIAGLTEAEDVFRRMRDDDPEKFKRISELRDGIRTGKGADTKGTFVFCREGRYKQLLLLDGDGKIVTRDVMKILSIIQAPVDEKARPLPAGYNQVVMKARKSFDEEVKHRRSEQGHTVKLTTAQKYILGELKIYFERTRDADLKSQINILDEAFRKPTTDNVRKELNKIKQAGLTGEQLYQALKKIYNKYRLSDVLARPHDGEREKPEAPVIVCSEALV